MELLLSEENSNWDLYDNGKFVRAIAKKGTWAEDSYFGSYDYFKRYVDLNNLVDDLTEHGLKIYKRSR